MTDQLFYVYEYGSGSTWGKYVVPASSCTVSVNHQGDLCVSHDSRPSVPHLGVQRLAVVHADLLPGIIERLTAVRSAD